MHEPVVLGGGIAGYGEDRSVAPPLASSPARDLLRFVISGSVDDGKSTLLGRLLYDSERLPEDELAALTKDSARYGSRGNDIDFALLVDGLAMEREQGITIDVAYRYFATRRRAFIVADTPGHEQYTRNMATGASTADVAVILVDARKGPLAQTRRHLFIVWMLGIRHVLIAVNKMDLVGYAREQFDSVVRDCRASAARLELATLDFVPISATRGDNVVDGSSAMPWYRGPSLLRYLETIAVGDDRTAAPLRFPVQWVSRPNAEFRGYCGMIASGAAAPGMNVICHPSGLATAIKEVFIGDEPVPRARAGQSVLLTLTADIDVARGDVMVSDVAAVALVSKARVHLFWAGDQPLRQGQTFIARLGTSTATAVVAAIDYVIDVLDYDRAPAETVEANGLAAITIAFDRPIPLVPYAECRELGGLILIDRMTYDTVALGLIVAAAEDPHKAEPSETARGASTWRTRRDRALGRLRQTPEQPRRSLVKALTWRITGGLDTFILVLLFSGSAKIAAAIGGGELATKLLLYYGHERIWARIRFGLRRPLSTRGERPEIRPDNPPTKSA